VTQVQNFKSNKIWNLWFSRYYKYFGLV